MMTFLGTVLILSAILIPFLKSISRGRNGTTNIPILGSWNSNKSFAMAGIGALVILSSMSTMFAREGHQYYTLSPFGTRSAITTPGLKMIVPFSKVQEWPKYIDIKCISTNENGEYSEPTQEIEGIIPNGVGVRFIDKVNADVFASVRFEIPGDEQFFIKLVETYRTPQNLVMNTLIPAIKEQLTNVTFMYAAEDYVSGSATDYKSTIEDALKNGGFVVKKVEVRDTIYAESMLVDSILKKDRQIREIRVLLKNEKILENGIPKRIQHEINVNKIITAQVIVSDVKLEQKFEDKLTQQRDISAEKIIEIQKVETARAAQQRIVAEGERDKAAERVSQEKNQVSTLIAIETKVKEEESNRQLAEIALKTEELRAKTVRVKSDAEAYSNRQMVSAGLTPQERATIEKETAIGVAAELAKMSTPSVVIMGDSKDGNNLTNSLIQAEMAKSLLKK